MQVIFYKLKNGRCCGWAAVPPKRRRFEGTTMAAGRDLPHDLAQFVVETALKLDQGFWGLLARGATFKSVPGRRQTGPGREIVTKNRKSLDLVERIVNQHVTAWRMGAPTPVSTALDVMLARWNDLKIGEELRLVWSSR